MAANEECARSSEIAIKEEPKTQNPIFPIFSNIIGFLQLNRESRPKVAAVTEQSTATKPGGIDERESKTSKPDSVIYPYTAPVFPPMVLETEEATHSSSSAVLWQVYALGGFIILKWVWARWKERQSRNDSSDADPSSHED